MSDIRQWTAPGRVNLLGEHLDYNGGPVLPMAIDRRLTLKARLRDDDAVRVWTTLGGRQADEFTVGVQPGEVTGWAATVAGVVWALGEAGHQLRGADLVIDGDLPSGAGLASSAATEAVVALALTDLHGFDLDRAELAHVCRHVENDFVGVPCGLMDQWAVLNGEAGHALFLNTSAEPTTAEPVSVAWADAGLALVVIDTTARHDLTDGRYAERVEECAGAAAALGLDRLAAAGPDAVLKLDDDVLKARTRHVITESARVRGAVRALRAGNWTQFGAMLTASHESLRADFAVSCIELDVAVEAALEAGALGARLTGAGFGGSAIALIDATLIEPLRERVEAKFSTLQLPVPNVFAVRPSAGAHEISS